MTSRSLHNFGSSLYNQSERHRWVTLSHVPKIQHVNYHFADYTNCIWAVHTLGGIVAYVAPFGTTCKSPDRCIYSPTNPASTADELVYQLSITKAKLIITHPICLATARKAANMHGLPENCIILIHNVKNTPSGISTLDELIKYGSSKPENYTAVRFKPGEAKTTTAFFCFSSGTTGELYFERLLETFKKSCQWYPGKPKVRSGAHEEYKCNSVC